MCSQNDITVCAVQFAHRTTVMISYVEKKGLVTTEPYAAVEEI